jgi:transglutaminase-like putative cysteine protease
MLQKRLYFNMILLLFSGLMSVSTMFAQEPAIPATDAELKAFIKSAGTSKDFPEAAHLIALDVTIADVESTGLGHIQIRRVEKILTDAAATSFTRLRFDYDPASNVIDIQKVRILRADGKIENLDKTKYLDLPQPQWAIIWGARMKVFPLPRLFAGDAIEYEYYKKGFMIAYLGGEEDESRYIPPMRGHYYDTVPFESTIPIRLKYYQVMTVKNKPMQYEVYNGTVGSRYYFANDKNVYIFWKENSAPFKPEPSSPGLDDLITKVVMTTVEDWPAKSRWFYMANDEPWKINPSIKESVFSWDAAIKQKVDEITRNCKTDSEKVAAIVHWSAQEIRYFGITMGPGEGYTIHPGKTIFNDRCGVCKDKAGIAITMLRAAGFEAYPAMTMAGARVERVPADQFNHCVAAWKKQDGKFVMLDPTWVPYSMELWSSAESEQHYVIGTPEGEALMKTPLSPAENHTLELLVESQLKANGDVEGTLTLVGHEYSDQRVRRMMMGYPQNNWRALAEQWISAISPQAELVEFSVPYKAITDFSRPLQLVMKFKIQNYAQKVDNLMKVIPITFRPIITSGGLQPYLNAANLEKRNTPLDFWCPRAFKVRETMTLPGKFSLVDKPESVNIKNEVGTMRANLNLNKNQLIFSSDWKVVPRTVPAEKYTLFKSIVDAVKKLNNQVIWLKQG